MKKILALILFVVLTAYSHAAVLHKFPEIPSNNLDDDRNGTIDGTVNDVWTAVSSDYKVEAEDCQVLSPIAEVADDAASGDAYVHIPAGNAAYASQLRCQHAFTAGTYYAWALIRNPGGARRLWWDKSPIARNGVNSSLGAGVAQLENYTWIPLGTTGSGANFKNATNGTAQRSTTDPGAINIMLEPGIQLDALVLSPDINADAGAIFTAGPTQVAYEILDIGDGNSMPTADGTIDAIWANVPAVVYSGMDTGITGAPVTKLVWDKDATPKRLCALHNYTLANLTSSVTTDDTDLAGSDTALYLYWKITNLTRTRDTDTYLMGVNMNATQAVIDANWPDGAFSTTVDLANLTHGRSYTSDVLVIEVCFDIPGSPTADQQMLLNVRANERVTGTATTHRGAFNQSPMTTADINGWGVAKLSSTGVAGVADETAPTVDTCSAINVGNVSFDAQCTTDEGGTAWVEYDTDNDGAVSGGDLVVGSSIPVGAGVVTINVPSLSEGTLYEWRMRVQDAATNIGNGAVVDTTTDAAVGTFYIATNGNDGNDGSSGLPWKTWAFALAQLDPGETLIVKNGTYDAANAAGWPNINCSSGYKNGTQSQPITVRAENERQAWLKGAGENSDRFQIENCSWWVIEGLRISDADNLAITSNQHLLVAQNSSNLTLRRLLLHDSNRKFNDHGINFVTTHNSLIEEVEIYRIFRHSIVLGSGSNGNIVRMVYCNNRNHGNIEGGYVSGNATGGDSCISIYPGSFNIIENVFAEGNIGQLSEINAAGTNQDNKFFGNVFNGTPPGSHSNGLNPNARGNTLTLMPRDITGEDIVMVGNPSLTLGVTSRSAKGTRCDQCTIINPQVGIDLRVTPTRLGDGIYSFFGNNISILGNGTGTGARRVETTGTWTVGIDYLNTFNLTTNTSNLPVGSVTNHTTVNPSLGGCYTHVRASSPLKGAGLGGADIGANITLKYQNGVKTATKLLDSTTGEILDTFYGARVDDASLDTTTNSIVDFISRLQPSCNWATDKPAGY